jgi:hypothetical protein
MGGVKGWIRGRRIHKSSLVREKFGRKATSNNHARRVQSMYGRVPLVDLESAAGNKLEKMISMGYPMLTLVKVGCYSALGVVHITRYVAPCHKAPFSLPMLRNRQSYQPYANPENSQFWNSYTSIKRIRTNCFFLLINFFAGCCAHCWHHLAR